MIIRLCDIKADGLKLTQTFPSDFIDERNDDQLVFEDGLVVNVVVNHVDDLIVVRVHVDAGFTAACSLCLKPAKKAFTKDFDLEFEVDHTTEKLDICEDLRQEILLSLPMTIHCSDDCKGLCQVCGTDLNERMCKC